MVDLLKTQNLSLITLTQDEVSRANAALNTVDSQKVEIDSLKARNVALDAEVKRLTALLVVRDARIAQLEALVPVVPPVVVSPVVPPVTGKTGLYVSNGKLFTKNGTEFVVRGIESMCGSDAFNAGPATWCNMQKGFGANTISPLWQASQSSVARLTVWMDAARSSGLVVGFNADHIPDGRAWLCTKPIVDLCNKYDNLFLQCEVETGWGQTAQQWLDDVKGMVKALRDAGHKHAIKVGSPAGGRLPKLAVENGRQVLDSDPLKNILFTWQSYWPKVAPQGQWHYAQDAGIPVSAADPGGAIEQCKRIKDSGLCFIIGVDKIDDVGTTIYQQVFAEADRLGLNVQHWVLQNDFRKDNEILDNWNQSASSITATGLEISDLLKIKGKLAAL